MKFEFDSSVRFDNSDYGIAKYTMLKDGVEYDEECSITLRLPFNSAYELSKLFDVLAMLSREAGHVSLMQKFEKFIDSEYTL